MARGLKVRKLVCIYMINLTIRLGFPLHKCLIALNSHGNGAVRNSDGSAQKRNSQRNMQNAVGLYTARLHEKRFAIYLIVRRQVADPAALAYPNADESNER